MNKILESIVIIFCEKFFGQTEEGEERKDKEMYVLSSVFPTTMIMNEVKKYL